MFQICIILASFIITSSVSTTVKTLEVAKNEFGKHLEAPRTVTIQTFKQSSLASPRIVGEFEDVCSGAILTAVWILTTAHNIDDVGGKNLRVLYETDPQKYKSQAFTLKTISNTTLIHKVRNAFLHPKWTSGTRILPAVNNLALLELEEPLKLPKDFKPFHLNSLDKESPPKTYNYPKTVFRYSPYKDQATTPILKMRSFTDFRCHTYLLDPMFMEKKHCGFICSQLTGSALWVKTQTGYNILGGISQLEILPCEGAPITVYTSLPSYTKDFIRKRIPEKETLYFL